MRVIFDEVVEDTIHISKIEDVNDYYIFAVDENHQISYLDRYRDSAYLIEKSIGGDQRGSLISNIPGNVKLWMERKKEVHVFQSTELYETALIKRIKELY